MNRHPDSLFVESAQRTISLENAAVEQLGKQLDGAFSAACRKILDTRGRVVVTGMGKSGHIAGK